MKSPKSWASGIFDLRGIGGGGCSSWAGSVAAAVELVRTTDKVVALVVNGAALALHGCKAVLASIVPAGGRGQKEG